MSAELPRVSVFEADEMVQIQIVKKKLEDAGIACSVNTKYLNTLLSTPTATALKLEVNILDEQKAFEIIDAYLQSKDN
ncbi:hypothetical protein GCM10010992_06890 [Cloacibacterium rupense]|uniref:Signal transducing protein n=1 Tax=Cloacibacterium rupense TaxID=517423 RepID=A0ABQ2NG28_9FLAO|nr:DUF2007 domain-containing protein [Cloacibacterium rupense]GGP02452.1 hypothetical protein GCM10010992_06890 [Cloacibacterium rupense]